MTIRETVTFSFEEIFALVAKDPLLTQLDKFELTGVHTSQRAKAPFTLTAKKELSWDDIHRVVDAELKKIGRSYADFTIQIENKKLLCIGKETSTTNKKGEETSASDIFINTSLKELTSDEGEITKVYPSVRLYNALKASCTGKYESITLKEFLCMPHKPRNFGKKSMIEFTSVLFEKDIDINNFPAKKWFPDIF